jgi:hypothetical protein
VLSAIAAGLIAHNLQLVFDAEFGDHSGSIGPDEFVLLCRRLAFPQALETFQQQQATMCHAQRHETLAQPMPSAERAQHQPPKAKHEPRRPKKSLFAGFGSAPSGKLAAASTAASRAEARLFALQSMLREDVVEPLHRLLVDENRAASTLPEATQQQLDAVLNAARRLADSGGATHSAAGAASEALQASEAMELQVLRRGLVETKLALAEAVIAKDIAEHALRQSMKGRSRNDAERRPRSSSHF